MELVFFRFEFDFLVRWRERERERERLQCDTKVSCSELLFIFVEAMVVIYRVLLV